MVEDLEIASRLTTSFQKELGLPWLSASSPDEYVERAVALNTQRAATADKILSDAGDRAQTAAANKAAAADKQAAADKAMAAAQANQDKADKAESKKAK